MDKQPSDREQAEALQRIAAETFDVEDFIGELPMKRGADSENEKAEARDNP